MITLANYGVHKWNLTHNSVNLHGFFFSAHILLVCVWLPALLSWKLSVSPWWGRLFHETPWARHTFLSQLCWVIHWGMVVCGLSWCQYQWLELQSWLNTSRKGNYIQGLERTSLQLEKCANANKEIYLMTVLCFILSVITVITITCRAWFGWCLAWI